MFARGVLAALVVVALVMETTPAAAAESDLDPTFGRDGVTVTNFGYDYEWLRSMAVQIDGKILALIEPEDDPPLFLVRYTADGRLDPTFGTDGRVELDSSQALPNPASAVTEVAGAVSVRANGDILVATGVWTGDQYEMVVTQFAPSGSPDIGFGESSGRTVLTPGSMLPNESTLLADGSLIVVGSDFDGDTNTDGFIAKLDRYGMRVPEFDEDGIATLDRGSTEEFGNVAIDSRGRIIVSGYLAGDSGIAALRFTPNGQPDSSFGTGGLALLDIAGTFNSDRDVAVDAENRVLIGGYVGLPESDFAVTRFTSDGEPDAAFGMGGRFAHDAAGDDRIESIAVLEGGSILAAGSSDTDVAMTRLDPDGTLDTTFGDSGIVVVSVAATGFDTPGAMVLDRNGAAIVGGLTTANMGDAFVMRFETSTRPGANPFTDDDGSVHQKDIETLAWHGITTGCGPSLFCPDDFVTRGQMAAFLNRAFFLEPPQESQTFDDDDTTVFEGDIEALVLAGITSGCGPSLFCPEDTVTRGQMAAFITRALHLPRPNTTDAFTDDDGSIFERDIEALAASGITTGCSDTQFCPEDPVTRAQMASFLVRALHLR